ncbi:MAG: adenylyltransferase/cytidyltransferase family protein [Oscillospiraceae bacterium]|nr:adenylyltransferase/cytidyltransferase family protein [Oscillospiraceae bacterium]
MIAFVPKDKLTILQIGKDEEAVTVEDCRSALESRPASIVYVEKCGKLYGIVTHRRLLSAVQKRSKIVEPNTGFFFVNDGEYLKARKIIFNKNIVSISAEIPVLNPDGCILGAYISCCDDQFCLEQFDSCFSQPNVALFLKHNFNKIALVMPSSGFKYAEQMYAELIRQLQKRDISFKIVSWSQAIKAYEEGCYLLLPGKLEKNGVITLIQVFSASEYKDDRICTYSDLAATISESMACSYVVGKQIYYFKNAEHRLLSRVLTELNQKGVKAFLYTHDERSMYHRTPFLQLSKRLNQYSEMPAEVKKYFFQGIYNESYEQQKFPIPYTISIQDGIPGVTDTDIPLFHVTGNERVTIGQPRKYDRSIYIFGPCFIIGAYCEDAHTIPSYLQTNINRLWNNIRAVNKGIGNTQFLVGWLDALCSTALKEGDIVLLYVNDIPHDLDDNVAVEIGEVFETHNVPAAWFYDSPMHYNYKANALIADAFFEIIKPYLSDLYASDRPDIKWEMDIRGEAVHCYLNQHFPDFEPSRYGSIGAIVMNCNPFTLGHRYLIEEAAARVDFLIIFVVEAEESMFQFDERFAMVRAGTSDLPNVKVVPSGDLILSKLTFPEYFAKATDEALLQNTENDIILFAERIAPRLNITCRFVGEEPEDQVTNAYNTTMKKILPRYGIKLVELPRKEIEGRPISASRARECLERNDWDQLRQFLPESSLRIIYQELH